MERAPVLPSGDLPIGPFRLLEGEFLCDRDYALELPAVPLEPVEIDAGELGRCDLSRPDEFRQLPYRVERQLLPVRGHRDAGDRAVDRRPYDLIELHADGHRIESKGGRYAVRDIHLPERGVTLQVVDEIEEHRILLGVREPHADDLLGLVDIGT